MIDTSEHKPEEPISEESDELTCDNCGCVLRIVSNLGGEACLNCDTFYAPYGFENHWTVVHP